MQLHELPKRRSKAFWIGLIGGAALLASGTTVAAVKTVRKMKLAEFKKVYETTLNAVSKKYGIPVDVLITFFALESGFNPMAYNAEPTAVARWACKIADDPKWRENPDYSNAVKLCELLKKDPTKVSLIARGSKTGVPYEDKLWKFGSFGLGQMSAIAARGLGFPHARKNSDLFIPEVNIDLVGRYIAKLREKLYPGRDKLALDEWSRVRAAYVGGLGVFTASAAKAQKISSLFRDKAKEVAA